MKSFGPKNFQIPCTDQEVPFWQFSQKGPGWLCTAVNAALKNPSKDLKILFALGANEFLAMLKGKIRVTPIFLGSIW
jgi:hypothetical protein